VICATFGVSYVYYTENKANAYEVCISGKPVAYIKEDKENLNAVEALEDEVESRFASSKLRDTLTINKSKVTEDFLISEGMLSSTILQNCNFTVDALTMLSDGKEIAVVANEKEGNQVLDKIKEYYISKSGLKVKDSKIKNVITYSKKNIPISKVCTIDTAAEMIEQSNSKLKKSLITVELKGASESKENIAPPTTVTWSDDMLLGESKTKTNGQEGQKLVTNEVVMENNKLVSSRQIDEKILTSPKEKIIIKGSKNPIVTGSAFLAAPSRGTVSSSFGMRWGKMHNGTDIAAPMNTPIYAALDGVVSYAGWETGYGNIIKISHGDDIETYYGHCSTIYVKKGQNVKKGEKIGAVGSTGNSTGPHLHFEVRLNGEPKNPMAYLK
jgi:murein DD-endopeptidase MepM/ murein hydrolase activator NlpD